MRWILHNRRIEMEPQPVVLAALMLGWSLYYYFSSVHTPDGGAESVLFVRPLVIILAVCFPFVVYRSVRISPIAPVDNGESAMDTEGEKDKGFLDPRRLFFASALGAYAVGITCFGYFFPSVVFIGIVCRYLGVRSIWILVGVPVALTGLMSAVFNRLVGVPIPIWPW